MNIALLLEYEGSLYAGWQIQPNAISIQEVVEGAAHQTFGTSTPVVGAGRTDTGVHARGQVAHMHLGVGSHQIPTEKIPHALNSRLPSDIRVRDAVHVHEEFHARYRAEWREYVYLISPERSVFSRHYCWCPDLSFSPDMLGEAAREFEGKHDFTTFSKQNPDTPKYECNIQICRVESQNDRYLIRIRSDRFVYGMCRSIVGTMMAVARGKFALSDIAPSFESRDRSLQPALAPPHGLILNRVGYPDGLFQQHVSF
jgi:tRNA pseudouridine38-40 synthase